MEAKKQLRKPENWEDFETLCKKLWGEIWNIPEIKKNGRRGQRQHGIDVYGIPQGEDEYYGIQCKGKDEYTHKQLTPQKIDQEIENAQKFKPPLKKFYFATSAEKDVKVEKYIRIKDLESRKKGLFEIHLFCWEDIVDFIDENKKTHDWYLKNQNFKLKADIDLFFEAGESNLSVTVPFYHTFRHRIQKIVPEIRMLSDLRTPSPINVNHDFFNRGENKSYYRFKLLLKNIGNSPIENPKILIDITGNGIEDIDDENFDTVFIPQQSSTDLTVNKTYWTIEIIPFRKVIVPNEDYLTSDICFKPKTDGANLKLNFKFISNDFQKTGELKFKVVTEIIRRDIEELVEDPFKVGISDQIEDFIVE